MLPAPLLAAVALFFLSLDEPAHGLRLPLTTRHVQPANGRVHMRNDRDLYYYTDLCVGFLVFANDRKLMRQTQNHRWSDREGRAGG
jgi:hypothetical protein